MTEEKNYFDSSLSIIKIVPEEFKITTQNENPQKPVEDTLRSEINTWATAKTLDECIFWTFFIRFSDPIVLLHSNTVDTHQGSDLDGNHSEKLKAVARKGNDGLKKRERIPCTQSRRVFFSTSDSEEAPGKCSFQNKENLLRTMLKALFY